MKISLFTKIYIVLEVLKFLPKIKRADLPMVLNERNFFITDIAFTFKETRIKTQ